MLLKEMEAGPRTPQWRREEDSISLVTPGMWLESGH